MEHSASPAETGASRRRFDPYVDRHVSERIRELRIMLGLTLRQLADLIGVSFQQAHKYEAGINRVSGGRLYQIAHALGVEINYFYQDIDPKADLPIHVQAPLAQQRLLLDLAHSFTLIKNQKHREAVCHLARALSHRD